MIEFKEYFTKPKYSVFSMHMAIFSLYLTVWLRNKAKKEIQKEYDLNSY